MSPPRNWDSPNPSLASECAPPPRTGGGHTRLRVRGWGSPNSDDLRKSLALCLLCAFDACFDVFSAKIVFSVCSASLNALQCMLSMLLTLSHLESKVAFTLWQGGWRATPKRTTIAKAKTICGSMSPPPPPGLGRQIHSMQGVTKRCRLSLLTNSALVYESQCGGWEGVAGSQPMSTAVHITWHGAQINFGDLSPYLTYDSMWADVGTLANLVGGDWTLKAEFGKLTFNMVKLCQILGISLAYKQHINIAFPFFTLITAVFFYI